MNKDTGRMAVVVPQGVLYRVGSEQAIRRKIIEANMLDAVIALPPRLFSGVTTQLCLMVFKPNRSTNDILFIDASSEKFFEKGKKLNLLREKDIEAIFTAYDNRSDNEAWSIKVLPQIIADQDYNFRVSQYLSCDADSESDYTKIKKALLLTEQELAVAQSQLERYLEELGIRDY